MAGNSWQQPVAGEPALGTFHKHFAILVTNADPTNETLVKVDCSGEVPAGAQLIYVRIQGKSTTVGDQLYVATDNSGTAYAWAPIVACMQVANVNSFASGIVHLASDRSFYYHGTADMSAVYIGMFWYSL